MFFISKKFMLMLLLTLCVGAVFSRKDVIADRLAFCKSLCNKSKKSRWFPWSHQRKSFKKSTMDPVGFFSSPFSQGSPTDFDRTIGQKYSVGSGFTFKKS